MSDDSFSRRLSALASRRRAEPPAPPVFVPEAAPMMETMPDSAGDIVMEAPVAEPVVETSVAPEPAIAEPAASDTFFAEPEAPRVAVEAPSIAPDIASEPVAEESVAPGSVADISVEPSIEEPIMEPAPVEPLADDEMAALRARLAARGSGIAALAVEELAVEEPAAPALALPPEIEAPVEAAFEPAPAPLAEPDPGFEPASEPDLAPAVETSAEVPAPLAAPEPMPAPAPAPAPVRLDPPLPPGMLMSFRPRDRSQDEEREFDPTAPRNRSAGYIVSCSGDHAIVRADTGCFDSVTGEQWAVGRLLSIRVDETSRIVALVHHVETPLDSYDPDAEVSTLMLHVELQGAVVDKADGSSKFAKGIDSYPAIGSVVHQIRSADLAAIYAAGGESVAEIGHLSQDADVPAFVDIEDMIAKHFAVLGSTGCGKSCSVSLLLHASQEIMPDLRVLILDPHNEYSCAFPDCTTITIDDLDLPFWMFQLDEYVECLFRGKPVIQEEVDALRDFIPKAKVRFKEGEGQVSLRSGAQGGMNPNNSITADTPVPYRISDVLSCLDEELGLLDSKMDKQVLKSLKNRIDTHANDPRFAFMFRHRTITDVAPEVVGKLFAMGPQTKGLTTVLQMAGMAAEVVNSCASVLCRMAFELAIAAKGGMKILVVCEEAHRYVPRDAAAAFGPTRQAIARIAKEGRKYGCFMSIVSQRPAELDPTILSQCCTVFSLRLSNDADQGIIRKSISTGSESAIKFLSSIGNREAIAFGEGFSTPMRMKFANLPVKWLPGQDSDVFGHMGSKKQALQLDTIMSAWRGGGH